MAPWLRTLFQFEAYKLTIKQGGTKMLPFFSKHFRVARILNLTQNILSVLFEKWKVSRHLPKL